MPPKLILDEAQLREAVATSTSYWQVARKMRPQTPRGSYKAVQRAVRVLGLDTSHFDGKAPRTTRWTDDELRAAVATSRSVAQVISTLGLIPAGGNYEHIQRKIKKLALDSSHFTGMGWSRGSITGPRAPVTRILVEGRPTGSHHLKKRLFREGLKRPACELCGWAERASDGRIPVELDHINGDNDDNRLENLRILCPNCHSLQPTHRGLNRKSRRSRSCEGDGPMWFVREAGLEPASPYGQAVLSGPCIPFQHSRAVTA